MEDILASIRRILSEDEAAPGTAAEPHPSPTAGGSGGDDGVLVLDEGMMVDPAAPSPQAIHSGATVAAAIPAAMPLPVPVAEPPPPPPAMPSPSGLLAPDREAATVASVGSLLRTLNAERTTAVHRGGPTIEDLVREEVRPLLKQWLDDHLPPLVERLVRAEIERVTGQAG